MYMLHNEADKMVYNSESIRTLVDLVYSQYYRKIILWEFIPYIFYTVFFVFMLANPFNFKGVLSNGSTQHNILGVEENEAVHKRYRAFEVACLIVSILLWFKFALHELKGYFSGLLRFTCVNNITKCKCSSDLVVEIIWQLVDLTSLILNAVVIVYIIWLFNKDQEVEEDTKRHIRTVGAVASFIMWFKWIYFFKIFKLTAYYIAQL